MNFQNQNIMNGSTEGTPITQLRRDLIQNDDDSQYSIASIKTSTDIRQLVNEINNDIKNKNNDKKDLDIISKKQETDTTTLTDTDNEKPKKIKKKNNNKYSIIEDSIYDGILLLIIFILMSQHFVKNFIGNYINIINVNQEGVVPMLGVVTYGFIFVVVFLSVKILIYKICGV